MTELTLTAQRSASHSLGRWLASHWFAAFAVVYGLWLWLPWLAPVLMHAGWTAAGHLLYVVYSFFCHQLPERSFFLFGQQAMYPLAQIQSAWQNTFNPMVLRGFVGNQVMGWKVAWSDRMVSLYSSIWVAALIWWPFRRKARPLPWWAFGLLMLPITLDGLTHMVSDLYAFERGFRETNAWLAMLTRNAFPTLYAGDALGSFNSWARLITGVLAGLGIVWFALPHVEGSFVQE